MSDNTHDILRKVVESAACLPGWRFRLVDEDGSLRLYITVKGTDNYDRSKPMTVNHVHPVPTATYNERSWRRWVFEQCRRTMNHELGESLRFGDERPFAPMHGPGEDPYT